MREEFLLVDGYNIINAWTELRQLRDLSLESARQRLLELLANYQGYKKNTVIVVFDAYGVKGGQGGDYTYNKVHVIFTKEAETADRYIERAVHRLPDDYRVRVASSDGLVQSIILGLGAVRLSARELKEEVEQTEKTIRSHIEKRPVKSNTLMDHLDEKTAAWLEEMRLGRGAESGDAHREANLQRKGRRDAHRSNKKR